MTLDQLAIWMQAQAPAEGAWKVQAAAGVLLVVIIAIIILRRKKKKSAEDEF
jgi:LPXTG-motif cell wall-anchored protein